MRELLVLGLIASAAGCGGSRSDVVARVGSQEFTVERMGEIMASSPDLPTVPETVEGMAMRWVEFSLMAMRAAEGDGLVDSATIVAATWSEAQGVIAHNFRYVRSGADAEPTTAQLEATFRAGDLRLLSQILKRTAPGITAARRASIRSEIVRIHEALLAGGSWADANAFNDDKTAQPLNGSIGLVQRGQTVPPFESVAFALAPGELSGVVETDSGFHLIYRPELSEVRGEFAVGLREIWGRQLDAVYQAELLVRRPIRMVDGVPDRVREVVAGGLYPERGLPQDVLATFDGGQFTIADLVRYLRILPPQFLLQAPDAPDGQLTDLVRSLVVRVLTAMEAEQAGASLSESDFERIRTAYVGQVERVQDISGIDPEALEDLASSGSEGEEALAPLVDHFIEQAAQDASVRVTLPPGLSSYLLENGDWEVFPAGIDEVVARAEVIRGFQSGSEG